MLRSVCWVERSVLKPGCIPGMLELIFLDNLALSACNPLFVHEVAHSVMHFCQGFYRSCGSIPAHHCPTLYIFNCLLASENRKYLGFLPEQNT